MAKFVIFAVMLLLCACSQSPARVIVQKVEIPVPVWRTPPDNLIKCTNGVSAPVFTAVGKLVVLPDDQIPVFQQWAALLVGCQSAWSIWATSHTKGVKMTDTVTTPVETPTTDAGPGIPPLPGKGPNEAPAPTEPVAQ